MEKRRFNKFVFSLFVLIAILIAGCSNTQELEKTQKLAEEVQLETEDGNVEVTYTIAVANEKDNTISVITYPEGKQRIIELKGSAHNVEINKTTGILWATIIPGHESHEEENGHTESSHESHSTHAESGDDHVGESPVVVGYDLSTLEIIEEYPVGNHPAHVTLSRDGTKMLVTNSGDNNVSFINRESGEITSIPTGDFPHGARISSDGKTALVANMMSNNISFIDLESKSETHRLEVGNTPVQVGINSSGTVGYVTLFAENQVKVLDLKTFNIIDTVDVGVGPAQLYVSPNNEYVIAANQGTEDDPSNTVTIIRNDKLETINLVLDKGPHGVVITEDNKYAFVTNMFENTVSVIDMTTLTEVEKMNTGKYPNGISVY